MHAHKKLVYNIIADSDAVCIRGGQSTNWTPANASDSERLGVAYLFIDVALNRIQLALRDGMCTCALSSILSTEIGRYTNLPIGGYYYHPSLYPIILLPALQYRIVTRNCFGKKEPTAPFLFDPS